MDRSRRAWSPCFIHSIRSKIGRDRRLVGRWLDAGLMLAQLAQRPEGVAQGARRHQDDPAIDSAIASPNARPSRRWSSPSPVWHTPIEIQACPGRAEVLHRLIVA